MHVLKMEFGLPVISFDAMLADERTSRAAMTHWLGGAGMESPSSGLGFVAAESASASSGAPVDDHSNRVEATLGADIWSTADGSSQRFEGGRGRWYLTESEFRELDYTHAGETTIVTIETIAAAPKSLLWQL